MVAWWVVPAIQAVGTAFSTMNANAQNAGQFAVNQYNANLQYNSDMANIASSVALAGLNSALVKKASSADIARIDAATEFNVNNIRATTAYNVSLLDEEEAILWEALDLDLQQLNNQRAVERGAIIANQAASGTIIGEGSNADVVVNQKTQEALDTLIVRHNADIKAKDIANARAQNMWQGEMAVVQTQWEGEMGKFTSRSNAALQSAGIMAQALISAEAGGITASNRRSAGQYGANLQQWSNSIDIGNSFVSGMFNSASTAITNYYGSKQPKVSYGTQGTGSSIQTAGSSLA